MFYQAFLSTLSLRRATSAPVARCPHADISIHALLARATASRLHKILADWDFYPRSPCGERPEWTATWNLSNHQFLSTLSLRRATYDTYAKVLRVNISIHALLAESDRETTSIKPIFSISIHALLAESDSMLTSLCCGCSDFYPRSPCGERPALVVRLTYNLYFYPRSPCGERPPQGCYTLWEVLFLSTLSLRRATSMGRNEKSFRGHFYPRSPCGERQTTAGILILYPLISIHALLAESDSTALA